MGGFGFGFGFGFGGGVGWFPLGWGEPFHPWYHCGPGYWHNVNVRNTYIRNVNVINNHNYNYAYAHNAHAVTATTRNGFVNGQSVHNNRLTVNEASLRNAHVTNGAGVSPNHSSYLGASHVNGRVATPSTSIQNRSVVARTTPAAGASHLQARTMNNGALTQGHFANPSAVGSARLVGTPQSANSNHAAVNGSSAPNATRQGQLSANRPPSTMTQPGTRQSTTPRTWHAQGNTTDSGHAPQGFGATNRPSSNVQTSHTNDTNRPPWARSTYNGANSGTAQHNSVNRPPATYNGNRANTPSYNGNRNYTPPSYNNGGNRNYSGAPRSYTPSSPRMTAPRTYSAPSAPRSYSAPSAPHYSGGGGAPHSSGGGGGGAPHGGGGGGAPHGGGGGGGGHPHR